MVNECKYCNSTNIIKEKNEKNNLTAYKCGECGKWLGWVTKADLECQNQPETPIVDKNKNILNYISMQKQIVRECFGADMGKALNILENIAREINKNL